MAKRYFDKTLEEWRQLPKSEQPVKVRIAIANADKHRAAQEAGLLDPFDPGPEDEDDEEVDTSEVDPRFRGPAHQRRPVDLQGTIKQEGEQFFREMGAVDGEGQFVLTEAVLTRFALEALFTLRYHNIRGDLRAADMIIHKLLPEPKQDLNVRVGQMTAEQLQEERARIMKSLSPAARAEIEARLKQALPAGESG